MRLENSLQHGCCSEGPIDGFTSLPLSYQKQSTVLTEAAVEAHVKPSAAWMLLRRLHGWIHAAFHMGFYWRLNLRTQKRRSNERLLFMLWFA